MKIGYARVSTVEQNLGLQETALRNAGCERIFTDQMSGYTSARQGLDKALDIARAGDTLVVWKLDRLGRSVQNLIAVVNSLDSRGIAFASLTDAIDTSTPAGRFFFHVMAALAEMERDLIRERTRAGLDHARKMGRTGGRPKAMTTSKIDSAKRLLDAGAAPKDVAQDLGISIPTLYRWLPGAGGRKKIHPAEGVKI